MCDCVHVCVCVNHCVLSESVRGSRSEGGRLKNRKREGAGQLRMSELLSCEERGGFCAVRTLSERCQNTVRTLSERCQNGQVSVRTGVGAPQTRFRGLPPTSDPTKRVRKLKNQTPRKEKKADNPREGWENGTPPPHRDYGKELRDMLSRSGASKTTGRKGGVTIRAAQEGCP